jgi:hypothetical protein
MRAGRNQSGFSRRGAKAPVPFQKNAPDESGAEKAKGVAAPMLLGRFLLLDGALFRRSLDGRGRLLGFAGVLRFGRLRLLWSKCSLGLGERVGFVFRRNADVVGQREAQGEGG